LGLARQGRIKLAETIRPWVGHSPYAYRLRRAKTEVDYDAACEFADWTGAWEDYHHWMVRVAQAVPKEEIQVLSQPLLPGVPQSVF